VVAEAETGQEALDSCQIAMPASIILDHHLAGMSDLEFIAAVKELCQQSEQDMPRIYVNLFEKDVIAIMRAKRAGASGFLLKPFNRTSLINTFRELDQAA
jgi:two-component system chemotaxis response regulator CheY